MAKKQKTESPGEELREEATTEEAVEAEVAETETVEAESVSDEREEKIKALEEELAAQKEKYMRLAAEYDNYRKRTASEKLSLYDDATAKAVSELLPVADSVRMALENLKDAEPEIVKGVELIKGQLGSSFEKLKIERSRLLLLEMPFERWSDYVLKEVEEISRSGVVTVLLAHVDRYYGFVDLSVFDRLRQNGADLQINAEAFDSFFDRAKTYKMIRSGLARFLGSDCHNLDTRAPKIGIAFDYIRKKAGKEFLYGMNKFGHSLFVIKQ